MKHISAAVLLFISLLASAGVAFSESADALINRPPVGHDGKKVSERLSEANGTFGLSATGYSQFMTRNVGDSYSYFPEVNGYSYNLLGGKMYAGIEVGCAGVSVDALVQSLSSQFEYIIDYYSQNALALAVTYLIYSRPTLAALIDKLKAAFEINLDHALLTCSKVKAMAEKKIADNPDNAAYNQCMVDNPGAPGACLGATGDYGRALNRTFEKADAEIGRVLGKFNVADKLPKTDVSGAIACSGLAEYEMKIASDLLPKKSSEGSRKVDQMPGSTVESIINSRAKWLLEKYDYMVRNYNESTWYTSGEFRDLAEFPEEVKLSGAEFRRLRALHSKDTNTYLAKVQDLAQLNAISTVSRVIDKIEYGVTTCAAHLEKDYPYDVQAKLKELLPTFKAAVEARRRAMNDQLMKKQFMQRM